MSARWVGDDLDRSISMTTLDDFEEGAYYVPVRQHWWQFWLPKQIFAGRYRRIGVSLYLDTFGKTWRCAV